MKAFLNCCAWLRRPSKGEVELDGWGPGGWRRRVGTGARVPNGGIEAAKMRDLVLMKWLIRQRAFLSSLTGILQSRTDEREEEEEEREDVMACLIVQNQ